MIMVSIEVSESSDDRLVFRLFAAYIHRINGMINIDASSSTFHGWFETASGLGVENNVESRTIAIKMGIPIADPEPKKEDRLTAGSLLIVSGKELADGPG